MGNVEDVTCGGRAYIASSSGKLMRSVTAEGELPEVVRTLSTWASTGTIIR